MNTDKQTQWGPPLNYKLGERGEERFMHLVSFFRLFSTPFSQKRKRNWEKNFKQRYFWIALIQKEIQEFKEMEMEISFILEII